MTPTIEIPRLRAVIYGGTLSTGRTCPSIFQCRATNGHLVEYVVKPYSQLGNRVVREALAALVGRQLGLPIPPAAAVDVDPGLVGVIPNANAREKFTGKTHCHFGSLYQSPGFSTIPVGTRLPATLLEMAIRIFAFDTLIQNPDRTNMAGQGKPNTLWNGEQLLIFDHELAFSFLSAIGGSSDPAPWELRDLPFARYHLFYNDIVRHMEKDKGISFDGFLQGIAGLTDEIFDSMVGALPSDWLRSEADSLNLDHVRTIVAYLKRARDNVPRVDRGLREVLA